MLTLTLFFGDTTQQHQNGYKVTSPSKLNISIFYL